MGRDPLFLDASVNHPLICLEAHLADDQVPAVFPRLADLWSAFQKVGPTLTFASRQALSALDHLRDPKGVLQATIETMMHADRIRYYWPYPHAQVRVSDLKDAFDGALPDAKLSKVFSVDVLDRVESLTDPQIQRLIDAQFEIALQPYYFEKVQ
jgi:D-tagatose-1,6-bisphosphate aldolase subunit GatZ/KbaZ